MGRHRKAWLWNQNTKDRKAHPLGVRLDGGRRLPGFYVRFSDYSNGVRVNRSLNFQTLDRARAWVRRFNASLELRLIGEIVPTLFRDAVVEYLSVGDWAEETARQYGVSLGLLERSFAGREVHTITPHEIAKALSPFKKATRAKHARTAHAFFQWCIEQNFTTENPTTKEGRGQHHRERPSVSEAQLATLVELADTDDRRLAIQIALTLGLDRGKIERLTPELIDRDTWAVVFKRPKTGKANALIIPHRILPALRRRLEQTPPGQPLLTGIAKERFESDWWADLRKRAGVPKLLFRDLRAVATARLQRIGGASTKDAQTLLGHASIVTTAGHYHVPDPELARRLRELPVPGCPEPSAPTTETP